jgi:hypothetical protein
MAEYHRALRAWLADALLAAEVDHLYGEEPDAR